MSSVAVNEIEEQEANIFSDQCHLLNHHLPAGLQARAKALQQLAVSEDSPFNLTGGNSGHKLHQQEQTTSAISKQELQLLRDEKARLLREETEEIKRQLELVKSRLNEFNQVSQEGPSGHEARQQLPECRDSAPSQQDNEHYATVCFRGCEYSRKEPVQTAGTFPNDPSNTAKCTTNRREFVTTNHLTSVDSQFYKQQTPAPDKDPQQAQSRATTKTNDHDAANLDPKFRPLTGKTDCPNCICDRRRSVCDECVVLQRKVVQVKPSEEKEDYREKELPDIKRQPTFVTKQRLSSFASPERKPAPATTYRDHDERPIRPAKQNLEQLLDQALPPPSGAGQSDKKAPGDAKAVDRVVVPNQVFTIGKSLNEKRTKLAQAIEDLQIMMDKVKKRGDRLEQERKVAQLYKDQWRFGPAIGGGSRSGSRDSLRSLSSQYNSRLDPNLARDTNSMMGFQHIEPVMRLRHYDDKARRDFDSRKTPPKPKPRLSKLAAGKSPDSGNYLRPTTSSALHSRSKSLENLPRSRSSSRSPSDKKPPVSKKVARVGLNENFQNGKSSSEINLTANSQAEADENSSPDQPVEEELEEEIKEEENDDVDSVRSNPDARKESRPRLSFDRGPVSDQDKISRPNWPEESQETRRTSDESDDSARASEVTNQRAATATQPKRVWVPVFGETEIKTVNRRPPERKVVVLNGSPRREPTFRKSILRQTSSSVTTTMRSQKGAQQRDNSTDRVLNEATKKLQFASNLMERERHDSRTKNQLVVNKHRPLVTSKVNRQQVARPISRSSSCLTSGLKVGQPQADTDRDSNSANVAQNLIFGANQEISRLEEMISEQQKLLLKLASTTTHEKPSAITCCHAQTPCAPCQSASPVRSHHHAHPGRELVNHLRWSLNKTKARLAKTLEEERAKHQQLEQKFDSSLRKQSGLEHENEMLKQSLSKCIDTCLRDISKTFESLSDTLSDSIVDNFNEDGVPQAPSPGGPTTPDHMLSSAAQLIADNRHLKKMKSHIDTIERQRRGIFEELNHEKHKSQQLELELKQSKLELDQLVEAKRQLECQLARSAISSETDTNQKASLQDDPQAPAKGAASSPPVETDQRIRTSVDAVASSQGKAQTTQKQVNFASTCATTSSLGQASPSDVSSATDDATSSLTLSSIDLYRQYIQSMTPDLDAIRRERRMILNEFDNIKKMLSDIDN